MTKIFDVTFLPKTVAEYMRHWAMAGLFDGTEATSGYMNTCRSLHLATGTLLLFTRDTGMHTSGWWKNPDYERCWHLSVSFYEPSSIVLANVYPKVNPGNLFMADIRALRAPRDKKSSASWVSQFYGNNTNLLWCEPPYTPEGKRIEVWHYRLFCAPNWTPIHPRGEVYHKEFTEKGWKSYSDVVADNEKAQAEMMERLVSK